MTLPLPLIGHAPAVVRTQPHELGDVMTQLSETITTAGRRLPEPPRGPANLFPGFGQLVFLNDPIGVTLSWMGTYGPIFRGQVGPMRAIWLNDADLAKRVLNDASKKYVRSSQYKPLKLILGEGLVVSEGAAWARQRRVVKPSFTRHTISSFARTMAEQTNKCLANWSDGATVDVFETMQKIAMEIVGSTVMSAEGIQSSQVGEAIAYGLEHVGRMQQNPFHEPVWFPTPRTRRFNRGMRVVREHLLSLIEQARGNAMERTDILGHLIRAKDDDGRQMTNEELLDQVMTFFVAGYHTTASTLTWLWYVLSKHPEVESKVYQEVVRAGSDWDPARAPQLFPYTKMVCQEVLRLYPPAWLLGRTCNQDDTLGGYAVRKGREILLSPLALHRHPAYWERPEEFYPEHFAEEAVASRHPYAYIPFGGGPRTCIGNHFAMLELLVIVPTIVARYRLHMTDQRTLRPEPNAVLCVEGSRLPMRLERRIADRTSRVASASVGCSEPVRG